MRMLGCRRPFPLGTRLRRFVLAKIRIHFVLSGTEKGDVQIPNVKANIFIKSKNTLFDSYIIRPTFSPALKCGG
jgi:hypothetical protein